MAWRYSIRHEKYTQIIKTEKNVNKWFTIDGKLCTNQAQTVLSPSQNLNSKIKVYNLNIPQNPFTFQRMVKTWKIVPPVEPQDESELCQLVAKPTHKCNRNYWAPFSSPILQTNTHWHTQNKWNCRVKRGSKTLVGSYCLETAFTFKEVLLKPTENPPTTGEPTIESVN